MRRRQSKRDGEDNQECVKSIDRSIDRPPLFSSVFSLVVSIIFCTTLFVVVGVVLFVPEETKRASSWSKTHVLFWTRDRVSEICFSLHTLTSRRFLSLSLSNNTVCCIGAGYVGGPTMAMIALKCPHIEVNRERLSSKSFLRVSSRHRPFVVVSKMRGSKMSPCSTHHRAPAAAPFFRLRARRNRRREKIETNDWSRCWWSFVAVFRREWGAHSLSLSFARM